MKIVSPKAEVSLYNLVKWITADLAVRLSAAVFVFFIIFDTEQERIRAMSTETFIAMAGRICGCI